jgi:hypothetical protein
VIQRSAALFCLRMLAFPNFNYLPNEGRAPPAPPIYCTAESMMDERKYLTAEEVSERYRGGISVGTLRNWRAMRIGPTFIKIGKAVLYPIDELEAWDQKNRVTCRAAKRPITDTRDDP